MHAIPEELLFQDHLHDTLVIIIPRLLKQRPDNFFIFLFRGFLRTWRTLSGIFPVPKLLWVYSLLVVLFISYFCSVFCVWRFLVYDFLPIRWSRILLTVSFVPPRLLYLPFRSIFRYRSCVPNGFKLIQMSLLLELSSNSPGGYLFSFI